MAACWASTRASILPGAALSIPALTDKDRKDLEFGLKHGVDMVAFSFVRSAADVRSVKEIIAATGSDVPVIAKLEKPQALEHLEEILEVADGVMVARGDLGVEMPPEKVPVIQKHVIRRAADWRKPVIIATQMLESMIENPRPTRAEASDVANAIFDGTDAVMLSAETASGRYPREAVAMMAKIVVEAESNMAEFTQLRRRRQHAALSIAEDHLRIHRPRRRRPAHGRHRRIHRTGNTARLISKYRPQHGNLRLQPRPGRVQSDEPAVGSAAGGCAIRHSPPRKWSTTAEQELVRARPGQERGRCWA